MYGLQLLSWRPKSAVPSRGRSHFSAMQTSHEDHPKVCPSQLSSNLGNTDETQAPKLLPAPLLSNKVNSCVWCNKYRKQGRLSASRPYGSFAMRYRHFQGCHETTTSTTTPLWPTQLQSQHAVPRTQGDSASSPVCSFSILIRTSSVCFRPIPGVLLGALRSLETPLEELLTSRLTFQTRDSLRSISNILSTTGNITFFAWSFRFMHWTLGTKIDLLECSLEADNRSWVILCWNWFCFTKENVSQILVHLKPSIRCREFSTWYLRFLIRIHFLLLWAQTQWCSVSTLHTFIYHLYTQTASVVPLKFQHLPVFFFVVKCDGDIHNCLNVSVLHNSSRTNPPTSGLRSLAKKNGSCWPEPPQFRVLLPHGPQGPRYRHVTLRTTSFLWNGTSFLSLKILWTR